LFSVNKGIYLKYQKRKGRWKQMKVSTTLKWVTGGLEGFLAIPIIGGTTVITLGYTPLGVLLILHIITLVFSVREIEKYHGSIWGIVTSCLAWIPFLGWFLHTITAIILMVDAYAAGKREKGVQV
jgi:predicted branched-subunit amino acid permease